MKSMVLRVHVWWNVCDKNFKPSQVCLTISSPEYGKKFAAAFRKYNNR